jgi:hypothetical protein
MDIALALITGILGSAGLFSFIQFIISRHDAKERSLNQIKHQLDAIENKCDRNEIATTRLQLIFLIDMQPQNKDTILQTAERYFVALNGNGEAWAVFCNWAKANKIDVGWYKTLLEREKGKNDNKCN